MAVTVLCCCVHSPMTRSLAEASTRELVSATPYRLKRDEVLLRLP